MAIAQSEDTNGQPLETQEADTLELLEGFASIPQIDRAWILSNSKHGAPLTSVLVSQVQRNLPANTIRKFISTITTPNESTPPVAPSWSPFPWELSGVALVVPAPSGEYTLLVRNGEAGKDGTAGGPTKLEIWGQGRLVHEVFVPASTHGSVYNDGWFEGVSWNQDETRVVYIAEEPAPERPVYGRRQAAKGTEDLEKKAAGNDAGTWKGRGDWVEDWGEKYTGKHRPLVYVLDIKSKTVKPVGGIPAELSAGQVQWAPPSENAPDGTVVFVGWEVKGQQFQTIKKLGMIYCFNRPCYLFAAGAPSFGSTTQDTATASAVELTPGISSAFSPRFSPDGCTLVFLSARAAVDSGAHNATNSLHTIPWPHNEGAQITTVIDVKGAPRDVHDFPGLYCLQLPRRPFLADGKTVILSTAWRSVPAVLSVDLTRKDDEALTRICVSSTADCAVSLLDVSPGLIAAAESSPSRPPVLRLFRPSAAGAWEREDAPPAAVPFSEKVETALRSLRFEVLQIPVPSSPSGDELPAGAKLPFDAVLVESTSGNDAPGSAPLLLAPHGGPHSAIPTSWIMSYAFLAALGFKVLHVNFRGSTGFGEDALQSLPGRIGSQDVADNLAALDAALQRGLADPDRVAVIGGSHGAFLGTHLIGQAPDRFKTAVLRNPVTSLSSMVGISDIPDWCFVETYGGRKGIASYSDAPTLADLQALHEKSPIAHVDKVKVPTLFFLGEKDRRVPLAQGLQYVHALRARGLESKVVIFPEDTHALDKPQTEFDQWATAAEWLKKHLGT
ncbi:Dipeptidyl aminopeptidase [Klebsormidium nitens]|uniref:acylaminoacyl-peptidase n=1 Tax=Klebsormidium nitens TaxID=105231 RepID=A0A1Y1HNR0_KLENI|nr:Dipeptidyl aminopeptidase [Klebsormidium nitens]|eukprot:GAQ80280.1 Dipeptidyl aminopeptidase [Klebsormidium nitens]